MKRIGRIVVCLASAVCIAAFCLIYTWPQTMAQRYPFLDLSRCTQIRGYAFAGAGTEDQAFSILPTDSHFSELIDLISSAWTVCCRM